MNTQWTQQTKFDVIVAGGGTAGASAAISAGRQGLTVLVVEAQSYLGGTSTGGLVTPMMWNQIADTPLNPGLLKELIDKLQTQNQAKGYFVNPFAMKRLLENEAIKAGVTILYESILTAVKMNKDTICGVTVETRRGQQSFTCQTLIDATGDAQASALAGVETKQGHEDSLEHQPMSLRFIMGGVDISQLCSSLRKQGGDDAVCNNQLKITSGNCSFLKKFAKKEQWPEKWIANFGIQFFEIPGRPNELWFNCPRLSGFDPLNPFSISDAYIEGRNFIDAYIKLFKKYVHGAENAFMTTEASQIGIREGRRIIGKYTLTEDDFLNARKFYDGICFNRYPIDIHRQNRSGVELIEMKKNEWHEIPLRCLIPRQVKAIIVIGRCISSDFVAQASYRIIANCYTMGQAAAITCRLAKDNNCNVDNIDGKHVREIMLKNGQLPKLTLTN